LLGQYFRSTAGDGATFDLDGLGELYQQLHEVNVNIVKRLREATTMDSSINAVVLLDMLTATLPIRIREQLAELKPLFAPYLETGIT